MDFEQIHKEPASLALKEVPEEIVRNSLPSFPPSRREERMGKRGKGGGNETNKIFFISEVKRPL